MDITIMRPGCFVDMHGTRRCFAPADLDHVARTYDPHTHQAPLVLGHPSNDTAAPAFGWVQGVVTGPSGALVATVENVSPALKEAVQAGHYRHLSASFWPPQHPQSPAPGGYSLRHIGILGSTPPAVKGLTRLDTLAFAECTPLACDCAAAPDPSDPSGALARYARTRAVMRATGLDWIRASFYLECK